MLRYSGYIIFNESMPVIAMLWTEAVVDADITLSFVWSVRGDQKVLQLDYKKLTYYIIHAVIF